ncbi:hypothetical protein PAEVO_00350 [Paenibacillus sp. GM2FR]|nr:hypothetical protein PAEVO_00350 [Paenibacillus sp. GM2FR]
MSRGVVHVGMCLSLRVILLCLCLTKHLVGRAQIFDKPDQSPYSEDGTCSCQDDEECHFSHRLSFQFNSLPSCVVFE